MTAHHTPFGARRQRRWPAPAPGAGLRVRGRRSPRRSPGRAGSRAGGGPRLTDPGLQARLREEARVPPRGHEGLVRESLRFADLAWTSPEASTPPTGVDEAWHAFWAATGGACLHHRPGTGRGDEAGFGMGLGTLIGLPAALTAFAGPGAARASGEREAGGDPGRPGGSRGGCGC